MHSNGNGGTYPPSQPPRDRGRHTPRPRQAYRPNELLTIPLTSRERLLASTSTPPTSADTSSSSAASPFNWLDLDRDRPCDEDDRDAKSSDLYFAIAADELRALTPGARMATPEEAPVVQEAPEKTVTGTSSGASAAGARPEGELAVAAPRTYKTYKRRWFGLLQLVLLNIIVSWDWLTFSAVSKTSAQYFKVTENTINWLSTGFLFAFAVAAPFTIITLHRGPKPSIIAASCLIFCGNWIRYAGARTAQFPVVMTGQILIGFAQPFVLSAPTTFSDLWFTEHGRTSATAVASLANPLGGALGQLISPVWAPTADGTQISNMVLYTAILSSVASLPSFFISDRPPTPASASSTIAKVPLLQTIRELSSNKTFYVVFFPFIVYVGFFNALSALINQILEPYGFSENQAGIAGGILIIVGILAAALIAPITDRTHAYVLIIKLLIPLVAVGYLVFLFAPPTRSEVFVYVILGVLGAASFGVLPVALEYVVEVTFPVGPEVSSVLLWTGGQLLGGIFTIIMTALKDGNGTDSEGKSPAGNMQRALIFQAVIACVAAVPPMGLGLKMLGLGGDVRRRIAVDDGNQRPEVEDGEA